MQSIRNKNPLAILEDESEEHNTRLERMEKEMLEVFNKKLSLKLRKIQETQETLMEEVQRNKRNVEKMKLEMLSARENYEKEKSDILFDSVSPSHSNKSGVSLSSTNSTRKIFKFNFDQLKMKWKNLESMKLYLINVFYPLYAVSIIF